MFKSIQINEIGNSAVMKPVMLPKPAYKDNEVLIKLEFAGINFIDVYFRKGIYKAPSFPFIPGKEGVGTVEEIGKNVTNFAIGDKVGFCLGAYGSYTTYAVEKENTLIKIPNSIPIETACAALLQGFTAHYLLNSTFPLKAGMTMLVHAGAGGVGQILCRMAKLKGAKIIATVSNEKKKQIALDCGADDVIIYSKDGNFSEKLTTLLNGEKLDVVYDSVGAPTFTQGLTFLKPRGMMALFGQSGGVVPPFDLGLLNTYGSLFVTRPSLGFYLLNRKEIDWRSEDIFGLIKDNKLPIQIGKIYPLNDAAKAHDDLENRLTTGKSLLKI